MRHAFCSVKGNDIKAKTKMKKEKDINVTDGDVQEKGQQEGQENACNRTENAEENGNPQDETAEDKEEESPLDAANRQIEELKDKYLRSVAEFDNYRKRTLKEKAELILNGGEKAVSAILPVLDDMERAIANGEKTDDPKVLREGIELIYTKFQKALESLGVKKIETADADFNTDVHEAIAMVPGMGDDKKGKVLDCVLNGYTMNEKVIRHAKVAVGQ